MSKEAVVILDREFHSQWTLKTLLEAEKYNVSAVSTKDKALKIFSEFEVSALITEYWLDQSNCLDILPGLKQRWPGLYVMMLTDADVLETEYEQIIQAGVDDFFLKPVSPRKLLIHLEKGLKQRRMLLERDRLEQRLKRITRTDGQEREATRAVPDR